MQKEFRRTNARITDSWFSSKKPEQKKYTGTPIDKKQRKDKKQVSSSTESASFASAIEEKAFDNFQQEIDDFVGQIELMGKQLMEKPNRESVDNYRNAIGSFLKQMSKNYASFDFIPEEEQTPENIKSGR